MHCIKSNFDKVKAILLEIIEPQYLTDGNFMRPGPKPKFTDVDVIALSLVAECMGIDSELYLFSKLETTYKSKFPHLISRRQYNDRRKSLFQWIEYIRVKMATTMNAIQEVYAIDSMPLEICKISRMDRSKMGKENEYFMPDKGYCASQSKYYYGYKLHAVCSPSGVIQSLDLSKASIHDIQYLKDVKELFSNCIITGDRGYINHAFNDSLLNDKNIVMEVPGRSNQKEKRKVMWALRKIRKRIETVFSQLCDQFMIQRNYAKSFYGFKTRILSKITGMTVLQYINRFINNRPTGQIKYALK